MRNPIRLKNLKRRFLPYYAAGVALLLYSPICWQAFATGLPLVLAGAALRTWAVGHLVKNERFTTTGPYAHLRHPLYLGSLLVATGFASMLGGILAVVLMLGVSVWFGLLYLPRKERVEAARLQARYGVSFERYRQQVPALWPRLRAWRPGSAGAAAASRGARWTLRCYDANNELGTLLAIVAGLALVAWRAAASA